MKRAPVVIGSTALGLGAVLGFHPHKAQSPLRSATPVVATATATQAASTPKPKATTGKKAAASATKTATGADASNQYGDVQVRVTVSGGKITRVTAVALPSSDPKSQEISSYAGPQLAQEAVSAQSAQIDGVSGASYTSESYKTSLQSALDKVGMGSSAASAN